MRAVGAVPNLLTGLRLVLLPVLIHLIARDPGAQSTAWSVPAERTWAALVLLVMGATDALDGWAARRLGAISRIGSLADAVADRLVLLVPLLFVALTGPSGLPRVPLWLPLWLVALDIAGGSAWLIARRTRGAAVPSEHNMPGRVAIWVLFALLLWIILGLPEIGVLMLGIAGLALATTSTGIYIRRWLGAPDLDGRSTSD